MSRSSALDLDRHSSLEKSRRSTTLRSGSKTQATQPNTGSGEVLCDFCSSTRKQRAVNSCLSCLASYCETHLQSHYEYPALMKHKLVKSTGQMREKICAQHDKLLEVFCRTDQTSVCVLCMMDEHKHHDTVAAGTERTEKQKQLAPTLLKSQKRIDEKVKKQQELRHAIESVKHSAQSVLQENERIFMELLRSIERRYNEVKEMVGSHEKTTVNRASLLQDRLEEEITLLKKKHTDLEKLSHTDDHIHFLQSWQSLSGPSGYEDLNEVSVAPNYAFDSTKKAIAALKLHVEETSKLEVSNISAAVKDVFILQPLDPKTREDFMKYSCNLTMDGNSAHPYLQLSEGNTLVKMVNEPITYPDNPGRFNHWQQVLCKEGLSGARFYWEVTWKGTEIDVAVAYKDMNRKGKSNDCSLGWNNKSWSLYCSESKYSFVHDNKSIDLVKPKSSLIGVYLDYKAGTLDFYSVSDSNMTLLHRAQSSFKEPLYPAFSVWGFGSSIQL